MKEKRENGLKTMMKKENIKRSAMKKEKNEDEE